MRARFSFIKITKCADFCMLHYLSDLLISLLLSSVRNFWYTLVFGNLGQGVRVYLHSLFSSVVMLKTLNLFLLYT
jgi:hypothetical protein